MSAPIQALPSWLTYSTTVLTDAAGDPISTSTTILTLPLTYYGPSIPLGSDGVWTYGGLTPPAPTSTAATTSRAPSITPSTTATPSSATPTSSPTVSSSTSSPSSSSSPPSSSSPSSTSSQPSSTSLFSSSSTLTSPSVTASATSAASRSFPRGLIGAIVGSIVGALLLLLLLLLCCRWRSRRRAQFRQSTPIWTGWEIVDPATMIAGGAAGAAAGAAQPRAREVPDRVAGEGSPRHSGEEHDPFLARRSDVPSSAGVTMSSDMLQIMRELGPGVRLVSRPGAPSAARATASARLAKAQNRDGGELAEEGANEFGRRRSVFYLDPETGDAFWGNSGDYTPSSSGSSKPSMGRQILSPEEQYRIESESDKSRERRSVPRQDSPLLPPPPIDPDGLSMPVRKSSSRTMGSMDSDREQDERAQLLTARRVRVSELPPPQSPTDQEHEELNAGPSSWAGLGGLARLRRLSWFKRESPLRNVGSRPTSRVSSKAGSRPVSYSANPLSDQDVEAGRALLHAEMGVREGDRPISTVSAKSGTTVYHDAASRPGSATPGQAPAGSFPSSYRTAATHPQTSQSSRPSGPPVYEQDVPVPPLPTQSQAAAVPEERQERQEVSDVSETQPSVTVGSHDLPAGMDILDLPAPSAESPFSTAASKSRSDLRFPPGLSPLPNHWENAHTPTDESINSGSHNGLVTMDILEEEPPRAGEGWRSLAGGAGSNNGNRRTTFGSVGNATVVHPRDVTQSEQGSLHSMRSHLSPLSSRSPSGSAAASSRHTLIGSNSSRPSGSGHSQGRSGSSGASLGHSGSISSEGRRRGRRDGTDLNSPAPAYGRMSLGATGQRAASPLYRSTPPPPSLGATDDHAVASSAVTTTGTMTGTGSSGSSYSRMTDPVTGAIMHFPTVPWTGVESDWPADAWLEMPNGNRLWGPPSQWRSMQARVGGPEDDGRS